MCSSDLNNLNNIIEKTYGKDDSEIIVESETKSISQSTTLLEDVIDYTEIKGVFVSLSRSLARKAISEKKVGFVIYITIKYFDFNQIVRSKKLEAPIQSQEDLLENAMELSDSNWNEEPSRLIGIGLSKLIDSKDYMPQLNLFEKVNEDETKQVLENLNKLLICWIYLL